MNDSRFEKPVPREPKSPRHAARVQVQNRRREYLERHPSYYTSLEHEFADPILYEHLVKRFQTPTEREAEGKAKGYGRTLEADLLRGEAKLSNLKNSGEIDQNNGSLLSIEAGFEPSWELFASDKGQGLEHWKAFLQDRFIKGGDGDFDYAKVDNNEELDVVTKREDEEAWFDEEEPSWAAEGETSGQSNRNGETGIQDF